MTTFDLPAWVRPVKDRHGKVRYRFRRTGWASAYLKGEPGASEFYESYAEILKEGPQIKAPVASTRKVKPKSLDDLVRRYKLTTRWQEKADSTKRVQERILERFCDRAGKSGRRFGERPVENVTIGWLEGIFSAMAGTPAAANVLRKVLASLMRHAVKLQWRSDNPVQFTDSYKEGDGFHTWTDEEITTFRDKHPLGTTARLVLELALNTAARRCNVAKLERDHIQAGRIHVAHVKGNNETSVRIMPMTQAALDALPAAPIRYLVTTQFGKPFTDAGLGNRMRKWCNEAGLPHCSLHGLRKAISRQLAESGATDAEGQAVTGHTKAETFAYYRAKADRAVLADRALSNLPEMGLVQPSQKGAKTDV